MPLYGKTPNFKLFLPNREMVSKHGLQLDVFILWPTTNPVLREAVVLKLAHSSVLMTMNQPKTAKASSLPSL